MCSSDLSRTVSWLGAATTWSSRRGTEHCETEPPPRTSTRPVNVPANSTSILKVSGTNGQESRSTPRGHYPRARAEVLLREECHEREGRTSFPEGIRGQLPIPRKRRTWKKVPATTAAAGMVSTHAPRMLPTVFHLTHLRPRVAPAPRIEDVIVCVVEDRKSTRLNSSH